MKEQISVRLREAMKTRNAPLILILRSILASFTNWEKANPNKTLEEISVIQSMVKQRKQSIEEYSKVNNESLLNVEKYELSILEEYLPKQLNDSEVDEILKNLCIETNSNSLKDMGRMMKIFNEKYLGQYDNKKLSEKIKMKLIK